jgi:hypothetical protein
MYTIASFRPPTCETLTPGNRFSDEAMVARRNFSKSREVISDELPGVAALVTTTSPNSKVFNNVVSVACWANKPVDIQKAHVAMGKYLFVISLYFSLFNKKNNVIQKN